MLRAITSAAFLLACTAPALAQEPALDPDRIHLSEIVPALAGTELGELDLGPAPLPGAVRTIARAEVLAAIRRSGRSAEGLAIPATARLGRAALELSAEQIAERARAAIERAVGPCEVSSLRVRHGATIARGEPSFRAEGPEHPLGGPALITIVIARGAREVRVPAQASLLCPEPVVAPGRRVTVRVAIGSVIARADGIARQAGRIGEVVRVHVESTGALVQARVVDASTVEVVR